MGLGLHKYINFNNKKFSVKFFNQRLPLIYILFNYLYRKLVVNSKLDDQEIIKQLTSIKGVGRWTAEMFLIFTLWYFSSLLDGSLI